MAALGAVAAPGTKAVGRDAELATLAAFLDSGPVRPTALVVEGEAGIGKTTIMRAALALAAARGLRVFASRPAAGEMELPYVGLGDLLATVDDETLSRLAIPQREAIESAIARGTTPVDEHALSRGVLELLRREASAGDLVIAVDDVQWLDRSTASALTFALRRLGTAPLRVLLAVRTTDGPTAGLPLGLSDWDDASRLAVGPLSPTELGAVLRQRGSEQLARPQLEAVHEASGGNPMFALELVRQGDRTSGTLAQAVLDRLRAVDRESQAVLSFAAAALRPSPELLLRAGVEAAHLESALDTGLIGIEGERMSFAHPMLGAAAYELLTSDERRDAHQRLAAVSSTAVARGHHISRAAIGPDESAAEALEQAADESASLGDHAGAAAFLLRAVELASDRSSEATQRWEVRAADELERAGDVGAATRLARALIDRLPPGVPRAQARRLLVYCQVGSEMSYEEADAELALTLADARGDDAMLAELHIAIVYMAMGMCRLHDAVRHACVAIELAERAGASATTATALAGLGFAECMLGRGVTEPARRAVARWDGRFPDTDIYSPRMVLALTHLHATAFDEAEGLLAQELSAAEEHGVEIVEVLARGHLAEVQLRAGRWAQALANSRAGVEHARQAANAQTVTGASYPLAMTLALLGRHEEATRISTQALAEAEATRDFWFIVSHRAVLGVVALAEDDPEKAVATLEPAWTLMLERELGDLSIFPVAQVLAEGLVAVGRHEEALCVAETLRESPVGNKPWCRAMRGRVLALVMSARGDHAGARSEIAAALEAHASLPEPFEHARTVHVAGKIEQRARNWREARIALVRALEEFDALGAARWAEKAAADIARLPGRRAGDRHELTRREREIADMVARGSTNKEVAAALFLTVRTVEANLSKVYAKLGVRSRAELAARFANSKAS